MKLRRQKLLVEPPSVATSDIAFNLIVFFLVCASVQPDTGRSQLLPRVEEKSEKQKQSQNVEVSIAQTTLIVNGEPVPVDQLARKISALLAGKQRPEDRVVIVKSDKETPYQRWIYVTGLIEEAGGLITLRLDEERKVNLQ